MGFYYLNVGYYNLGSVSFIIQNSYKEKQNACDTWNLHIIWYGKIYSFRMHI